MQIIFCFIHRTFPSQWQFCFLSFLSPESFKVIFRSSFSMPTFNLLSNLLDHPSIYIQLPPVTFTLAYITHIPYIIPCHSYSTALNYSIIISQRALDMSVILIITMTLGPYKIDTDLESPF